MSDTVEWCIIHPSYPDEAHRGPMSEAEARTWLSEFESDGGREGLFYVASRRVSHWKRES